MRKKSLQLIKSDNTSQEPTGGSSYKLNVFKKDIRYLQVKDVKRAYSKLIQDWCKGLIQNDDAKTLAYLLAGYIQTVRQYEIEAQIRQLEEIVKKDYQQR